MTDAGRYTGHVLVCKESGVRSRYGLHPSLVKPPRAASRNDLLRWDYFNRRTISAVGHKNPKHSLENNLKLGVIDVVKQVCLNTVSCTVSPVSRSLTGMPVT